ncbi:MAG: helix-turn-helix domain-containing protein [Acidobacteriota bacterium]|nr:helix-turn-helix domain-containing protein [Acidobacteriota bacterium]
MVIETNAKLLTSFEAAEQLEISPQQLRLLIRKGRLPAEKQGRDWFIKISDLRLVKVRPKGRPAGTKDSKPRKASKKASRKNESGG